MQRVAGAPEGVGRARAWLARARERLPVTNLGLAVALVSAATYELFARPRVDYVLQLISALALLLVVAALVAVVVGAILTHRALRERATGSTIPQSFEARRGFLSLLRLPSLRFLPLVEVTWSWESPDFAVSLVEADGELVETIEHRARWATDEIVRRFVIEDGFGLARIVLRRREARALRVLPWTGALEQAPMLRALSGGDDVPHPSGKLTGDRVDLRRYVAGDPLRLVLWKVYARTGELMVRTPERAIAPAVRIVAYLPAAVADEPPAAAARVALEAGLFGGSWSFGADGGGRPVNDLESAIALIVSSRRARGTAEGDAAGLASFVEAAAEGEPVRIILFLPARPGPWMERVTSVLRRFGGSVTALVVTDAVEEGGVAPADRWLDRILFLPPDPDPSAEDRTTPEAIAEVARGLGAAGGGAQLIGVERTTGRELPLGARARSSGGGRRVA